MTTSINVNVTLSVHASGEFYVIYSAADQTTALYLNKGGDLDFRKRRKHEALCDKARINFTLLSPRLGIGEDNRIVTFRFDTEHPEKNIDILPAQREGEDCDSPRVHRHRNRPPKKPKNFGSFASSVRRLSFTDDNDDHGDYKYTLFVATGSQDDPWLGFDPRIINQ